MAKEKTFTESEVKAMIEQVMEGQSTDATDLMKKQAAAAKLIGPIEMWARCFTCNVLSDHRRYETVDWEPKDRLEYHSSEIWREIYPAGKYFCVKCHKAVHMREGKELKRRIKAGEIEDPLLKPKTPDAPVVGGMTRSDAGTAQGRS